MPMSWDAAADAKVRALFSSCLTRFLLLLSPSLTSRSLPILPALCDLSRENEEEVREC
jgi:hypothetical protein